MAPAAPRAVAIGAASFFVVDDKETFWDKVAAGAWEPDTLAAVGALAGPGTLLIDLGAWIGPISLMAAARGARVLAFEPDPRAFELLAANLAANPALAGAVRLHNRAAAPEPGRIRLGSPRKPGDSMGSILMAGNAAATWEADTLTSGDIAALADGAERIVLKIDIEGAEYALLPHLAPLLGPRTAAALVAFHPRLLQAAGHATAEIERLTDAATAVFAGYRARPLDLVAEAGAPVVSTTRNATVLFSR